MINKFYALDLNAYRKISVDSIIYFDGRTYEFLQSVSRIPEDTASHKVIKLQSGETVFPISTYVNGIIYLDVSPKCISAKLKYANMSY